MIEYKKNDKGIWLPINIDVNKNHNEINWKKFKVNILNTLKFLSESLPLITVFSTVVGAFSIYSYLKIINYDFLFSDIIGEPSSLIAIVLINLLFFLLLSIGFLSPFLLNILLHTEIDKNNTYLILKIFHTLSICYTIFNFIGFIIAVFGGFNFDFFIYLSSSCFFILTIRAFYVLQVYYQVKISESFILSLFVIIPYCLHFIGSLHPIVQIVADKENFVWLVFIISHILIIFNSFMAILYAKSRNKDHMLTIICIVLIVLGYFYLIPHQNYEISLHKPKFIEKPQNSSWYIIHNGNTNSETINGMTKDDIKQKKEQFFNAKKCTDHLGGNYKEKCDDDNQVLLNEKDTLNQRDNALYGYMAWNLGNTKVFCPVSVDFFDGKDNTEKSAKCLVIDGKYLQLVSEYYLKQPTER